MVVNRKRDGSLKAGILNLLWLVVISICLVGLVVLFKVLSVSHIHIVFRVLLILSVSFLSILLTNFLFRNSPRVKIYRRQAGQFHAFCRASRSIRV